MTVTYYQRMVQEITESLSGVQTVRACERKLETLARQRETLNGRLEMTAERRRRTSRLRGAAELRIEDRLSRNSTARTIIEQRLAAIQAA